MTTEEQQLVERDIYEVANQLHSYVGPDTAPDLAAFLLREGAEAAKLADTITRLVEERDEARARVEKQSDYSIQLQRLIEAVCHGRELRDDSADLFHHKMILNYRAASEAKVAELTEALKDILTACECPYPINHRDAIDCHKAGECGCVYGGGARALEASK